MEKIDSLFERYLRQWDHGRPQGAHNVPRRGQLRDQVVAKRKFKELVFAPSKHEEDKGNDCKGGDESSSQEGLQLKHLEITS